MVRNNILAKVFKDFEEEFQSSIPQEDGEKKEILRNSDRKIAELVVKSPEITPQEVALELRSILKEYLGKSSELVKRTGRSYIDLDEKYVSAVNEYLIKVCAGIEDILRGEPLKGYH